MMGLFLRLLLAALLAGVGAFFTARYVYRKTRTLLGYDDEDPVDKARSIARRVHRQLEASTGSSEVYGTLLRQISEVVETKLPRLASTRDRLSAFLSAKPRAKIESEIRQFQEELARASDPEVQRLIEKNIRLAFERLDTLEKISTLRERTVAQIKNVQLTVESLEDRFVSLKLHEGRGDVVPQLEGLMGEVDLLEAELKKMKLIE
jgi:predicted  nucleic acid-binding Zn-ribbon protein